CRCRSNHLKSSTKQFNSPLGSIRPQSGVITSGPPLASEAIAGRPHAIPSSRTNPKPSENVGNTMTSEYLYSSRSAYGGQGGSHLTLEGNDRHLVSASCHEPTSTSSESFNAAFSQASVNRGTPFRTETCPAYMKRNGPHGSLAAAGVQNSKSTPYGVLAISFCAWNSRTVSSTKRLATSTKSSSSISCRL